MQALILIMGDCIVQAPIYMHLLTITWLHNKAVMVAKALVKFIYLGIHL